MVDTIETTELLRENYTALYLSQKHDSPEQSRISLSRRIFSILKGGIPQKRILNIGSGPQSLEKQLHSSSKEKDKFLRQFHFATLDLAEILKPKLLAKKYANVEHLQANAVRLPFADESFGLVVSNHAIDFAPREAFSEANRVLVSGGTAIFYLHHPHLLPQDISSSHRHESVKAFWTYLQENNLLFQNPEEIKDCLENAGFSVEEVNLATDHKDKWWEVVARKQD